MALSIVTCVILEYQWSCFKKLFSDKNMKYFVIFRIQYLTLSITSIIYNFRCLIQSILVCFHHIKKGKHAVEKRFEKIKIYIEKSELVLTVNSPHNENEEEKKEDFHEDSNDDKFRDQSEVFELCQSDGNI